MDEERFVRFEMDAHDIRDVCRNNPAGCVDYRGGILASIVSLYAALDALREYQESNRRAA